jgi:hypothetical protein
MPAPLKGLENEIGPPFHGLKPVATCRRPQGALLMGGGRGARHLFGRQVGAPHRRQRMGAMAPRLLAGGAVEARLAALHVVGAALLVVEMSATSSRNRVSCRSARMLSPRMRKTGRYGSKAAARGQRGRRRPRNDAGGPGGRLSGTSSQEPVPQMQGGQVSQVAQVSVQGQE